MFLYLAAFYLPRPSTAEYHFVYVDKIGQVCAQSRPFTFCAPKPLDELETLSEERNEEEEGDNEDVEELLLVVPRAQLLQVRKRKLLTVHFSATLEICCELLAVRRVSWRSA